MIVGHRLKKLRETLGLTQKQFVKRVSGKVDYTYIGMIERGKQYPSLKLLERIGKAYSVPLSYFFEDGRESNPGMISYIEILDWLNNHEERSETTAEKRLEQRKFMMFGYWKAISVHLRKMKRELFKSFIEEQTHGKT